MHLVIVGGVAAGTKAAARARRVNPDLRITLLQDEFEISYSGCGQPYYLGGVIAERDSLIVRRAADFGKEGISVRVRHRVTELDTRAGNVQVHDLDRGASETLAYDRLIIATGARAIIPAVPGTDLGGVVSLRSMAELDDFRAALDQLKPRRAVIVGGGYIGLEVAEALAGRGISVVILERGERLFEKLDAELSQRIQEYLAAKGIEVILGDGLAAITGSGGGRATGVTTESGRTVPADLVVLAIGVRPNVELAAAGGIDLGPTGAIAVDSRMRTGVEGVYAAGDCAESFHRVARAPVWGPLGDIANLQGRVAGENAAGGDAEFPGVLGTAIFKTFELNVGLTGLTEAGAREAGFEPVSALIDARDKPRYFPGSRDVALKLVADARGGRLLGAQCVGSGAVDKLIDIAATALLGNLRCSDLENADLAYAPPFSPVLSPVIVAARQIRKRLA